MLNQTKINKTASCWVWSGSKTGTGYGQAWRNGKHHMAHRIAFEDEYGPIPPGLQIDHLCFNKLCVNPEHLRLATPRENLIAGPNNLIAKQVRQTHCKRGHEFTPANTILKPSRPTSRVCRECKRVNDRFRGSHGKATK